MPSWGDLGNIWATLREVDVSAIRAEAERDFHIALAGDTPAVDAVERLLTTGAGRFPAAGQSPLLRLARGVPPPPGTALLIEAVDTRAAPAMALPARADTPRLAVALYDAPPRGLPAPAVALADPDALDAADTLAAALLQRLPDDLHLAAARRLPGLRPHYAQSLINAVSLSNAGFSLATGVPEVLPIMNIPFVAADIIVLTKNQALMVYRLALAHGAPPDLNERIREVIPVIGGAFLWRQAARSLVGLIPFWGIVPKVVIAYAGTYATGVAAWRWFATGELVSRDQARQLLDDAIAVGRVRTGDLVARARAARVGLGARVRRLFRRKRAPRRLPTPDIAPSESSGE
jgi:uncharacterized protein (DUF697 family)